MLSVRKITATAGAEKNSPFRQNFACQSARPGVTLAVAPGPARPN